MISRTTLSAALFIAICILTILDALFGIRNAGWTAVGLMVTYLVLEFASISTLQRTVGMILVLIGAGAGLASGDTVGTLLDGLRRTLPFLLLFASVAWLQAPAGKSDSLLAVREAALNQPPGRRFAYIGLSGHFLGVAFNLAGLSLLTPMVGRNTPRGLRHRLGRAMAQGFAAGTAWSPFYVGTAVILASVPGVRWIEVAPAGFLLAMMLVGWSWTFDRLFLRPRATDPSSALPDAMRVRSHLLDGATLRRIALLLGTLFGLTILLVDGLGLSIPVSLAIVAPPFALVWWAIIHRGDATAPRPSRDLVATVVQKLPDLRGEVLLFAGANIMGVGVAAMIDRDAAVGLLSALAFTEAAMVPFLMASMAVTSILGLHPVVFVVLVTAVFTPEALGVAPPILALAMMTMWGQGTNCSPFSATCLYLARITGESSWTVAWRWNAPYVLTSTVLLSAVIIAMQALGAF